MAIYFGNNNVAPSGIASVYFGNNKVYEASSYPSFANATWAEIKEICQSGLCSTIWNVGDTKTMVAADGTTYTIRIADMTPNRYAYTDGSRFSNAVFEFVECVKNGDIDYWPVNSTKSNDGGWAAMPLKTTTLPTLQTIILPTDLQALLVDVNILSLDKVTSESVSLSANKLFLPAAYEIIPGSLQPYLNEVPKGIWQYYNGKGAADRIKYTVGTSYLALYWLRSAHYSQNTDFQIVWRTGNVSAYSTNGNFQVAPCFAF